MNRFRVTPHRAFAALACGLPLLLPVAAGAIPYAVPYVASQTAMAPHARLSLPPAARAARATVAVPAPRPPGFDPEARSGRGLIYVSGGSYVTAFPQDIPESIAVGVVAAGVSNASGIAVSPTRDLYVANEGNDTVTVYHPGETSPYRVYESLPGANGVTIDARGDVFVSCYAINGGVYAFHRDAKWAYRFIPRAYAYAVALDSAGDVFVEYNISPDFGQGRVAEYRPHVDAGKDLGIRLGWAGGIALDAKHELIVGDQGGIAPVSPPTLATYRPGDATPVFAETYAYGSPIAIATNAAGTHYYVSGYGYGLKQFSSLLGYDVATNRKVDLVLAGGASGVALSP